MNECLRNVCLKQNKNQEKLDIIKKVIGGNTELGKVKK